MLKLNCAILLQEHAIGSRLVSLLSERETKLYTVSTIPELQNLARKRTFDIFIWITTKAEQEMAAFQSILSHSPYFFACLFTNKMLVNTPFDFVFTFDDFRKPEVLNNFIANLSRSAMRLKTGKELSSLLLHDLRTPLQNLSSYVDMLSSGTFGELNDGQLKILRTINAQTAIAEELLQELTLYLRLRKKEFFIEKRKTNLSDIITETLRAVWIWADRKNIKLKSYAERNLPLIYIDPLAIRRVLFNLLLNALKFSPDNSTVQLSVKLEGSERKKQKIHISISDNGPGIDPEYLNEIFDPYFRLKHPHVLIKGQGLGLYIAKLFVEAHGGAIGAYNNREGGATFHFTLPLQTE